MINLPRLRAVLNNSGIQVSNNALYQVINEMLSYVTAVSEGKHLQGPAGPRGLPGPSVQLDQTFVTSDYEPTLINSRKLVAGSNITLDSGVVNELKINSSGGGAGDLEIQYLGDYTTPQTYNDGDIVIGPDGIAYLCVVDGTTTPPEPWPGIGISTVTGPMGPPGPQGPPGENTAIDATYWTATPHAGLANEYALSGLTAGYVKHLFGVPSAIAIIPVGDGGTGASNPTTARTNLGIGTVGPVNLSGNPNQYLSGDGTWKTTPVGIHQGTIILSSTPCPPGWTRVGGPTVDGAFMVISDTWGLIGGSSSHAHAPGSFAAAAHAHGAGSYNIPSHNHGGVTGAVNVSVSISGTTGGAGSHDHGFSWSGTTGGESNGSLNVDAGSSGNMTRSPHTHGYSGSGTTDNEPNHAHSFSGSGSGSGTGSIPTQASESVNGTSASGGNATITGTSAAANHLPPFFSVILCYKD